VIVVVDALVMMVAAFSPGRKKWLAGETLPASLALP
jgi:hypothetical protein